MVEESRRRCNNSHAVTVDGRNHGRRARRLPPQAHIYAVPEIQGFPPGKPIHGPRSGPAVGEHPLAHIALFVGGAWLDFEPEQAPLDRSPSRCQCSQRKIVLLLLRGGLT